MSTSNVLLAVEEILDGRLTTVPSGKTFNEEEGEFLSGLVGLSKAGDLSRTREWLEIEKERGARTMVYVEVKNPNIVERKAKLMKDLETGLDTLLTRPEVGYTLSGDNEFLIIMLKKPQKPT